MTKPKPKTLQTPQKPKITSPLKPQCQSDGDQPVALLKAPEWLYAIVQKDEETRQPIPVIALAMEGGKMKAYIPLKDELVTTGEVEMFVEFYCGDPDLYTFEAEEEVVDDDEADDEDEDEDEADDDEADEED